MGSLTKLRLLGFADYLALERQQACKHEFVAGRIYAMAGASERHNLIVANAAYHLRGPARGGPCRVFIADMKVRVASTDACYYPDVMVVCDPQDTDAYVKVAPCVIVEVISKSTETTDRREKLAAYRTLPSLRYYILVSSLDRRVECYARNAEDVWEVGLLEPGELVEIQCGEYRAVLDLGRLYEDVAFTGERPKVVG